MKLIDPKPLKESSLRINRALVFSLISLFSGHHLSAQTETGSAAPAAGPSAAAPVVVETPSSGLSSPSSSLAPRSVDDGAMSVLGGGSFPELSSFAPLQWGPIGVHPRISYSIMYGNGIQRRPGEQTKSTIQTIAPGVLFNLGNRWTLDYTATQTIYSNRAFENKLRHAAQLSTGANYGRLGLQFHQSYASVSAPLVETGRQTGYERYTTDISGSYALGYRTRLNSGILFNVRSSDAGPETRTTTWNGGINYQVSSKLNAGWDFSMGEANVSAGVDTGFLRTHLVLGWRPTEKLSANVQVGAEKRQFRGSDVPDMNTPTYTTSVSYRPFSGTTVTVSGSRSVSASFFRDQVVQNTRWTAGLSQRLLTRYRLGVDYSIRNSEYRSSVVAVGGGRGDDTTALDLSLGTGIFARGNVSLTYTKRENESNRTGFTFTSQQYGLRFNYSF